MLRVDSTTDPFHAARTSLLAFTQHTKPEFDANWHHVVICEALDRVIRGDLKRLMLFMPPRYGKSELVSRRLPAFAFGVNPNLRMIATSYGADLSSLMNRDVQRIIESREYAELFPDTKLWGRNIRSVADGSYLRNNDIFEVVGHKGYYRSAGVGGGITGMGFDIGIIDDPFKNRKEANSETLRQAVWEWYTSTFYTRQENDAAIIIILTRWHMDDLAGRLLKAMSAPSDDDEDYGEKWEVIEFPAIAGAEKRAYDPRSPGDALWERKHTIPKLRRIERTIGAFDFEALFQQNPVPAEGGIFKRAWFSRVTHAPPIQYAVRYWDLAMSEKTSADYTAGVKIGIGEDGHRYVLDVVHERIDWGNLTERLAQVMIADGPNVAQGIEQKGYMSRAVSALNVDPRLHGYQVWGYEIDKDKLTRALPVAAKASAGVVHVLDTHWTDGFLDELCSFPFGAHDDQVDAFSGAEAMLGNADAPLQGEVVDAGDWQFTPSDY